MCIRDRLPESEIAAVASFLRSIYACDVDSWPVESLAHRYWNQFHSHHHNSVDYVRCLRRRSLTMEPCYRHTAPHCGRRFGERSPERLANCNRLLWSDKFRRANFTNDDTRRQIELYRQCIVDLRSKVVGDRRTHSSVAFLMPWFRMQLLHATQRAAMPAVTAACCISNNCT